LPLAALASDADIPVAVAISRVLEALKLPLIVPYLYPIALVAFGAGYRTRWSNAIVFVLNSTLFWRNPYILSGAEDLARLLLLWCLFLPMSRYWSVDAALDPQPRERPWPTLPFVALRLPITSVYFFAGIFKLAGLGMARRLRRRPGAARQHLRRHADGALPRRSLSRAARRSDLCRHRAAGPAAVAHLLAVAQRSHPRHRACGARRDAFVVHRSSRYRWLPAHVDGCPHPAP